MQETHRIDDTETNKQTRQRSYLVTPQETESPNS